MVAVVRPPVVFVFLTAGSACVSAVRGPRAILARGCGASRF